MITTQKVHSLNTQGKQLVLVFSLSLSLSLSLCDSFSLSDSLSNGWSQHNSLISTLKENNLHRFPIHFSLLSPLSHTQSSTLSLPLPPADQKVFQVDPDIARKKRISCTPVFLSYLFPLHSFFLSLSLSLSVYWQNTICSLVVTRLSSSLFFTVLTLGLAVVRW